MLGIIHAVHDEEEKDHYYRKDFSVEYIYRFISLYDPKTENWASLLTLFSLVAHDPK